MHIKIGNTITTRNNTPAQILIYVYKYIKGHKQDIVPRRALPIDF